ncbi:MAG: imidazolonepropionase, partial [Fidelibacterota bacterium]
LRIEEFALRAVGMSYQEIAAAGGGILASVRAVREASQEELEEAILQRLEKFLALGTTTLEAKSGYGLSLEAELKSLRALKHAADRSMIDVVVTFLGAHDFPQEYRRRKDDYVALICEEMIPAVAEENLAEYCDVFCEKGWYTVEQSRQILETAINYGLKPRLHADEFTDSGAASLAAEIGATSADHLMYVSEVGLRKMGVAGVVATLLPGTTFFLGQQMFAPARKIIDAGLTVALATDYNPGSSFIQSLPFIMSLASLYLQMTVEEAFRAVTFGGAAALQKQEQMGTITVGRQADIVLWAIDDLAELACRIGENRVQAIVKRGEIMKLS